MKTRSAIVLFLGALVTGCQQETVVSTVDVEAVELSSLPEDPTDSRWESAPPHVAPLLLQDMVDPRLMEPSTTTVTVQALTDGSTVAFRLQWEDATLDDRTGPSAFADACAVQVPRTTGADLPAPQMGEAQRPVEIAYWRASWQAVIDGRGDSIRDLYPAATVDHYPFEAAPLDADASAKEAMQKRYAPARALENTMAGPRDSPVQALVAEGPGTLTADDGWNASGKGVWSDGRWTVTIARPLPPGLEDGGQVAFAVWQGNHQEAGARKMRTGWIALTKGTP